MSRWYRAYEGTVTDAKLGEAALVAECSRSVAIAAWHCLLESAACKNNGGSFETTPRRVAVILCEPPARIDALFAAFSELGMLADGSVTAWKTRQYESDSSTERSRKCRERQRNGDATLQEPRATAPETEAETDTPRKRGGGPTAFPVDWELPAISSLSPKAQACAAQWPRSSYETVGEAFCLHWRNGAKRKPNWHSTFCVWVIREHSKVMRDVKFGSTPPATIVPVERDAAWHENQARFYDGINKPDDAAEHRKRAMSIGQLTQHITRAA